MNTIHINSYKSFLKKLMLLGILLISILPLQAQKYENVFAVGPIESHDLQYFYIDTKIPFIDYAAPQIHLTAYNHFNPNKAIKLTLGWYHYKGAFYWAQYKSDLGYYNPSRIRIGTYDNAGVKCIRIEIANDSTYWSQYFISATDLQGYPSYYTNWTSHLGPMPAGTGNIVIVNEHNGFVHKKNGNVGIGTNSPDHKLDVVGTIRAHEVMVNTQKGADFVFDANYALRPLSEVEEFITTHKHLPEIKPASEMEQDGLNMSEFQIKLLQKIEELTLYLIEQEKTNKEQQKIIDAQSESNKALELRIKLLEK